MKVIKIFLKILLPVVVVAGGIFLAYWLIVTRPEAPRTNIEPPQIPVEVLTAKRSSQQVLIDNVMGIVVPAQVVTVQPQVSGLIVEQSDELFPGGFFRKDDILLKIDRQDYRYIVDQREERVEQAKFNLKDEEGRKAIAEREWKLLGKEVKTTDAGRELALRKPHLKYAQAVLKSAESGLDAAKLNLERTTIRAPFNAWVKEENADPGQLVSQQSRLATLVGTDRYWVQAMVSVKELPWFNTPGIDGPTGSKAKIVHDAGERFQIVKEGRVIRLIGNLGPNGQMAKVLIAVDDPLGLESDKEEDLYPLLLDSRVQIVIEGKILDNVFVIPENALRDEEGIDSVWIVNEKRELEIKAVNVVRKRKNDVLARGIDDGDLIVTSLISAPLPGTKLRILGEETEQFIQTSSSTVSDDTHSPAEGEGS